MRRLASLTLLIPWCALVIAQEPVGTPFRSGTELVALQVAVTDGQQRFVSGLQPEDFTVFEEGVPQRIALFAPATTPLDLMLLLDTSASLESSLPAARAAAIDVVDSLRPGDRASVVLFDTSVRIVQPLTDDKALLEQAIARAMPGGSTALYDALYISLRELERAHKLPSERRQSLIALTDGDDTASRLPLDAVHEQVRSGSATMFLVIPPPPEAPRWPRHAPAAAQLLREIAEESGGRSFAAKREGDLADVFSHIAVELGQQYWLAYAPTPVKSGFRRISVRVAGHPGRRVRTRTGYYRACRKGIDAGAPCR